MLAVAAVAASIVLARGRQVPDPTELNKPKVPEDTPRLEALRAAGF